MVIIAEIKSLIEKIQEHHCVNRNYNTNIVIEKTVHKIIAKESCPNNPTTRMSDHVLIHIFIFDIFDLTY